MLLRENHNCLGQKKQFHCSIYFQACQNLVRKSKVYKTKAVIQNLAIKCYHEFHVTSHKGLEVLILAAHFLLLTNNLTPTLM